MPALGGALHWVLVVMPRLVFQICAPVFALSAYSNPSHDPTYTTSVGVPLMTSLATLADAAITPPVVKFQSFVSWAAFAVVRSRVRARSASRNVTEIGRPIGGAEHQKGGDRQNRRHKTHRRLQEPHPAEPPQAPNLTSEPYQEPDRGAQCNCTTPRSCSRPARSQRSCPGGRRSSAPPHPGCGRFQTVAGTARPSPSAMRSPSRWSTLRQCSKERA